MPSKCAVRAWQRRLILMHLDKYKQYSGRLTTGANAVSHPVMVRLTRGGIEIDAGLSMPQDKVKTLWHYGDITSGVPITNSATEVLICDTKQPGATLYVADGAFAANLVKLSPQISAKAWRIVGLKPAVSVTAAVAAFIGIIYVTDYSPAKTIASVMPDRARNLLGQRVITSMTKKRKVCRERAGARALDAMMKRLSDAAGLEKPFQVTVVKWRLVNAFAAPGGRLVLTSGLIRKATSADMVAGVMAHEMGHGIELHPEAGLVRALGMSAAGEFFFTGSSSALKNIGFILATLSYTRAAERQADQHALKILKKAGISSKPLSQFFKQIAKKSGKSGLSKVLNKYRFLSTHPPSPERAKLFNASAGYNTAPALAAKSWAALRDICGKPPKRLTPQERIAQRNKYYAKTVARQSAILAKNPTNIKALVSRANAYKRLKQYDKALADLDKVIKLQPDKSLNYFKRALIYEQLEKTAKAIADYTHAIALAPKNSNLLYFRARLLIKQKKWDEAIWDYNTAIALKPKYPGYYVARAGALRGKGDMPSALKDIAAALKISPNSTKAYLERGKIRAAMSQDEDAIADYSKALSVSPKHLLNRVYMERGQAYERVGDRDAAIADYRKSVATKTYSKASKKHQARARARLKSLESAQ